MVFSWKVNRAIHEFDLCEVCILLDCVMTMFLIW